MKDFLNREITVGCMIVYPVRRRSSMWLANMTVTDLGDGVVHGVNSKGRRITVSKVSRCVVIKD